jgi:hypothetical protein
LRKGGGGLRVTVGGYSVFVRLRQRGTWTLRRWAILGAITLCLCVLIVVLPTWTAVSPFLVFGIAWAALLALLILLPKRA